MPIAQRLLPFGTTIFADITSRAMKANAINLGQGMPDFDGPIQIKDAASRAMNEHLNQYAPMPGVPELRRAIAARHTEATEIAVDPDAEITVTAGCTGALAACHLGMFNPGDEIITFEPYYDAYPADAALAGAKMIAVALRPGPDGFAFDPEDLRSAITPRTRGFVFNTPHNPTGKVFTEGELSLIASLCAEHDLVVIADEVYDRLVFDVAQHVSIASLPGMAERTVTLGSFGKTFSMTGWKIGWAIAPPHLTAGIRAAHQFINFAVATPLQYAAAETLANSDGYLADFASSFQARRDTMSRTLLDLGFLFTPPEGGYFILADHRPVSARLGLADDIELCHWLIEHAGVATIPPSVFYANREQGRSLLRFAFCKSESTLEEADRRLRAALA
ncbi:MAG: aminotransferase class I/II-fold pyridoxal phosphate-dependent enzyme [Planctomycetota bacterium]